MGNNLSYKDIEEKIKKIAGFLIEGEAEYLFNLVKNLPDNSIIVEIGSLKGLSSIAIGYACIGTNKKAYCIDPWEEESLKGTGFEKEDVFQIWLNNIKENNLDGYLIPIKDYSTNVLSNWSKYCAKEIDLIFIDGDHSFKSVYDDFYSSFPHIKENGLMVFQDVATYYEGCEEFWYKIGSKKLINNFYFKSLACGYKPKLDETKEFKNIQAFMINKDYDISESLIKAISASYPNSLTLKVLSTYNQFNLGNLSELKYKIMELKDKFEGDLSNESMELLSLCENKDSFLAYLIKFKNLLIHDSDISITTANYFDNSYNSYLISFILLYENNIEDLINCILSLKKSTFFPFFEIIIVHNDLKKETDLLKAKIGSSYNIKFVAKNGNKPKKYNSAIKNSNAKYIKLMSVYEKLNYNDFEFLINYFECNSTYSTFFYDYYHQNDEKIYLVQNNELNNIKDTLMNFYFIENFFWKKNLHDLYGYLDETIDTFFIGDFIIKLSYQSKIKKIEKNNFSVFLKRPLELSEQYKLQLLFLYNNFSENVIKTLSKEVEEVFNTINKYKNAIYNYKIDSLIYEKENISEYLEIINNYQFIDSPILLNILDTKNTFFILKFYPLQEQLNSEFIEIINSKADMVLVRDMEAQILLTDLGVSVEIIHLINSNNKLLNCLDKLNNKTPVRFKTTNNNKHLEEQALTLFEAENFIDAEILLEKIIIQNQESYKILYVLALCKIENKKYKEAIKYLSLAYELEGSNEIREKIDFCLEFL